MLELCLRVYNLENDSVNRQRIRDLHVIEGNEFRW